MPGLPLSIGVDVGTQGARVVVADATGRVLARASESWPLQADGEDAREQDPARWWAAVVSCTHAVRTRVAVGAVASISVAATSGTLVLADARGAPVRPAMMWNDKRARAESAQVNRLLRERPPAGYVAPQRPTSTLSKAMWVRAHEPEVWARGRWVLSAGDWLLSRLTGAEPVTDYTNALKSGFDLQRLEWPAAIEGVGLDVRSFPDVVAPGTPLGTLSRSAAAELGLPPSVEVVAGVTDANAALVAAGAVTPGAWCTTIGTGLSVKGVSRRRLADDGAFYSHRHWSTGWIASATSHCGADSIAHRFPSRPLDELSARGRALPRSSVLVLPLSTVGEFFPFHAPAATGFEVGTPRDEADAFRGYLEGIGFVERMILERMRDAGADVLGSQVTMGGGAANADWLGIRAAILGRPVSRMREATSAFGAAIVAAAGAPERICERAAEMTAVATTVDPDPQALDRYTDAFGRWQDELRRRGYLRPPSDSTGATP